MIKGIGIMADDGHASCVFAFRVIFDTGQTGVILIDTLPGKRKIQFRDGIFHPSEYPDAETGDSGVGEEGMRIGFDTDECLGELPGWDAINVDHDESGIAGDVCGSTSACE